MRLFLFTMLFTTLSAEAHIISVVGPCDSKPLIEKEMVASATNVGDLTVKFLTKHKVPFEGNERGLHSVYGTPVGNEALEILSDTEMRAYGWCYLVNKVGPDVFPHEYPLSLESKKIEWFFGFAHYKNGEWITYCTPAHTIKPAFLCK